jgi:two-component system sensor histidine kinase TtrS
LSRLFEPFFTTKANGLGMGLAISKTIIESFDGALTAKINPKGNGMTFGISIPIQR